MNEYYINYKWKKKYKTDFTGRVFEDDRPLEEVLPIFKKIIKKESKADEITIICAMNITKEKE